MSLPSEPVATKADPNRGPLLPPTPADSPPFHVAQPVLDVEDSTPAPAIVVDVSGKTVSETRLPASNRTIADVNPDYSPDQPAITVAFLEEFRTGVPHSIGYYRQLNEPFKQNHPENEPHPIHTDAVAAGVSCYTYPASRLEAPPTAGLTVDVDVQEGFSAAVEISRRTPEGTDTETITPDVPTAKSPTDAGYRAILAGLDVVLDGAKPVLRLSINIDNMDLIDELCTPNEPDSGDFHAESYEETVARLERLLSVRCGRPKKRTRF